MGCHALTRHRPDEVLHNPQREIRRFLILPALRDMALRLAGELDNAGLDVFIDFYDGTLDPADKHLDSALVSAIRNSDTMVIVVSDETRQSWWVPWEIGVSTPYGKPRAIYTRELRESLPTYLSKLRHLKSSESVRTWVVANLAG